MISYRKQLAKIGYQPGTAVHYRDFYYRPTSLRKAMRAMDAPASYALETEAPGRIDEDWTEEIQGVLWDGAHWLFSSNADSKAVYTFNGSNGDFGSPDQTCIISQPNLNHVGALYYHNNVVYVEHWIGQQTSFLAFQNNNGALTFTNRINIEPVQAKRVGVVGVDFESGTVYTCAVEGDITLINLHKFASDFKSVSYTKHSFPLKPAITDGCYAQGGFFSPNGHLYIASGREGIDSDYQYIYCYSALNGLLLNKIPVLAEKHGGFTGLTANQELEGIFYAPVMRNNKAVQIHAVLLENIALAKDNIFFKSFSASEPDFI